MFKERLRKLREDKELLQRDIAEYLGITPSAYGFYESGRCEPDISTLIKLANFFNVTVDYLLGLTDDPKRKATSLGIKDPMKIDKLQGEYLSGSYKNQIKSESRELAERIDKASDKTKQVIKAILEIEESKDKQSAAGE